MGKFRDKHGKSRIKALIEKAKEQGISLPKIALDIASVAIPSVGKIREAIQEISSSPDIAPELKAELINAYSSYALALEEELTRRNEIDANSNSWLSQNIRPIITIALVATYLITWYIITFNPGALNVPEARWISIDDKLDYCLTFYFGGKTLERIAQFAFPGGLKRNQN